MTQVPTIAIVTNKYGDPEAFAERNIEVCDDFQTLAIGTNLIERKHLEELQAKFDALHELAVQANQNSMVIAGYFKHHHPGLAAVCLDWTKNIEAEIKVVAGED